jgi:1,4-dihydroxy-2-naphthoyl-CoA hydrolase
MSTPIRTGPGTWTIDEIRMMPRHGFQRLLGLALRNVAPDAIDAEIEIRPEHCNSVGTVHGGVLLSLADSLGAMGAVQHLGPDQRTATLESKANFVSAARGSVLLGLCRPVHVGRRTSVWMTRIVDGDGRLVSMITQTQIHLSDQGSRD